MIITQALIFSDSNPLDFRTSSNNMQFEYVDRGDGGRETRDREGETERERGWGWERDSRQRGREGEAERDREAEGDRSVRSGECLIAQLDR